MRSHQTFYIRLANQFLSPFGAFHVVVHSYLCLKIVCRVLLQGIDSVLVAVKLVGLFLEIAVLLLVGFSDTFSREDFLVIL